MRETHKYRCAFMSSTYPDRGFWWRVWTALYFVATGELHIAGSINATLHDVERGELASGASAAEPPPAVIAIRSDPPREPR